MNPDLKAGSHYDYLNREERRKKGQRSGFKLTAKLSKRSGQLK